MAVRKRGSRPIVIDGVRYRWRVPGRPTYAQAAYGMALAMTVWQDGVDGSVLHMHGKARPDNWMILPGDVVTPRRVATGIRAALAAGWNPSEPGPAFEFELPSEPEAT